MCGRFTLTLDPGDLQELFPDLVIPSQIKPRFNIAPSQPVAVIPNTEDRILDFFVWGLIPSWAKDPEIGSRLINARSETLAEKPSFRTSFKRRRCLILADGFYEWQQMPGGGKQPVYIHMKSRIAFTFAGLWDIWRAPDGSEVRSCTIITTEPNELLKPIHSRMPVILPQEAYSTWLTAQDQPPEALTPLLTPYRSDEMAFHPVSRLVNSPNNDVAECIQPVTPP
jgi:putative SOS response-associated peptidase YedK